MKARLLTSLGGAVAIALSAALTPAIARPQQESASTGSASAASATPAPLLVPFGVGETLSYDVAVGGAKVGSGQMLIDSVDTLRGLEVYHSEFTVKGGIFFFKVNDRLESWFDPRTQTSRRFLQQIKEGGYHKERFFEIYPDREVFHQRGYDEMPSVANPLDDGSFLYFVRTVPLEIGKTYTFNRYFRPEKNPVIVKVLRKERVKVPAGTFNTIVLQPIIKSGGLFADGGEAQMWLSDDDRRMMVQFKAKLPVLRTLDLYLKSYTPPTATETTRR